MAFAILRIAKLKGGMVSASDEHTDRIRKALNADEQKTKDNIYLIGKKGDSVKKLIDAEIARIGGKPRKDSVECVEFLMTASPQYFNPNLIDQNGIAKPEKLLAAERDQLTADFMEKSSDFIEILENRGMKFVKAVVHLDETSPHIAAYAIPLDPSGKLNAKFHLGGKAKLSKLQDEYAETMSSIGLQRGIKGSTAKHERIKSYYGRVEQLHETICELEGTRQQANEINDVLSKTTELLNAERQRHQDISLVEVAQSIFQTTVETSYGLAVINNTQQNKIVAVVSGTNQAFNLAGDLISDGSSIKMLTGISDVTPTEARKLIENYFGKIKADAAATKYGVEITKPTLPNSEQSSVEWDEFSLRQEILDKLSSRNLVSITKSEKDFHSQLLSKDNIFAESSDNSLCHMQAEAVKRENSRDKSKAEFTLEVEI